MTEQPQKISKWLTRAKRQSQTEYSISVIFRKFQHSLKLSDSNYSAEAVCEEGCLFRNKPKHSYWVIECGFKKGKLHKKMHIHRTCVCTESWHNRFQRTKGDSDWAISARQHLFYSPVNLFRYSCFRSFRLLMCIPKLPAIHLSCLVTAEIRKECSRSMC